MIRDESDADDMGDIITDSTSTRATKSKVWRGNVSRSIVVNAAAGSLSLGVALVVFPLYAESLGAHAFGLVLIGLAAATIVVTIDLGLGAIIARRAAFSGLTPPGHDYASNKAAKRLPFAAFVPALILGIFASFSGLLASGGLAAVLCLAILGGFVPVAFRRAQSQLEGSGRFAIPRAFIFVSSALRLVAAVAVLRLSESVAIPLVLTAECSVLWLPAIGSALSLKFIKVQDRSDSLHESWSSLSRYGFGSFISAVVGATVLNVDTLVVGAVLAPAAVVIFAAGARTMQVYRQVAGWVMQPLLSKLMQIHSRQGNNGLRKFWFATHPIAVVALSSVAVGTTIVGFVLVPLLLPQGSAEDLEQARLVLGILCGGVIISSAHQVGQVVLTATRNPIALLSSQLAWAGLRASAGAGLGYLFGIPGAAVGILLATIVVEPFYLRRIASTLDLKRSEVMLRAGAPALGLCLISIACAYTAIQDLVSGLAALFVLLSLMVGYVVTALLRRPNSDWGSFA